MTSSLKDDLKSFQRSWVQHTGMQSATLAVLAATFSVAVFVLALSTNFNRILASWGDDGVQMTVYLQDEVEGPEVRKLADQINATNEVREIVFVPRELATENFKAQMASYAPDLLADADFSNPFPASFRVALKGGVAAREDVERIGGLAAVIKAMPGVEDVSYGEGWVQNYSSFVTTIKGAAGVLALVLIAGSLFVTGNSIRASISARREEIEILELVGATSAMIRRPFVFEGLAMGVLAAIIALAINLVLHTWQKSVLSSSLALARLVPLISFLDALTVIALILLGAGLGALGAWLTVRRINDGWSAKQGLEH